MAKNLKGILSAISGRLGPIVGGTWKGIPYLRMTPKSNGQPKKQSSKQMAHRAKFVYLTKWLKPFHAYVTLGFKNMAEGTTEISAAFSYNFKAALLGEYPNFEIDYARVMISLGKLPNMYLPHLSLMAPDRIRIDWQLNPPHENASYDDQLMVVVYSRQGKLVDGMMGGTKRTQKTCTFVFDERMAGHELDVYVSFWSINGRNVSNSQYLGRTVSV